jgi:hypothetical protein
LRGGQENVATVPVFGHFFNNSVDSIVVRYSLRLARNQTYRNCSGYPLVQRLLIL